MMEIPTDQNKHLPCVIYRDYILYLCKLFYFYLFDMIAKELEYLEISTVIEEQAKRIYYMYV
nr:MAG TPA: hypothetical protein [Caudoviricetes sp.]